MSELISGKDALIALANGEEVEFDAGIGIWHLAHKGLTPHCFDSYKFRLKPRTITINGIEVPAPFEPEIGDVVWCISDDHICGYCEYTFLKTYSVVVGAWRTEEEIKQVITALRKIFND